MERKGRGENDLPGDVWTAGQRQVEGRGGVEGGGEARVEVGARVEVRRGWSGERVEVR